MRSSHHHPCCRRAVLCSSVAASAILPGLLSDLLADEPATRPPHAAPRAKSVIFLFMTGGVSHIDTFDPKPQVAKDVGKELQLDHPEIQNRAGYEHIYLKAPQWE